MTTLWFSQASTLGSQHRNVHAAMNCWIHNKPAPTTFQTPEPRNTTARMDDVDLKPVG